MRLVRGRREKKIRARGAIEKKIKQVLCLTYNKILNMLLCTQNCTT